MLRLCSAPSSALQMGQGSKRLRYGCTPCSPDCCRGIKNSASRSAAHRQKQDMSDQADQRSASEKMKDDVVGRSFNHAEGNAMDVDVLNINSEDMFNFVMQDSGQYFQ